MLLFFCASERIGGVVLGSCAGKSPGLKPSCVDKSTGLVLFVPVFIAEAILNSLVNLELNYTTLMMFIRSKIYYIYILILELHNKRQPHMLSTLERGRITAHAGGGDTSCVPLNFPYEFIQHPIHWGLIEKVCY